MGASSRRQYRSGSVFQRKDGLWIGRFEAGTDNEGRRRRITVSATTESACKEKLERRKVEVARAGVPEKRIGKQDTVAAWSEKWLKMVVTELRPKAFASTRSAVKVWIVPTIGRKRLVDLTPADVRAVVDAQRKKGKAESTRVRTHSVLMSMLKAAKLEGHDVPERVYLVKKPKVGENDREAIPADQAIALLQSIAHDPESSLWAAALLQGMRVGERLGLTWDCVDFDNDLLDISWQLQPIPYIDNRNKHLGFRVPDGYRAIHLERSFHLVRPKSSSSRRITPMIEPMRLGLLAWRKIAPESPHGLVWPQADGSPRRAVSDRDEWRALHDTLGLRHPTGRHYVVHEARHTAATLLRQQGVDRETAERILGQSEFLDIYDHADHVPAMRDALRKVSEQLALSA